MQNEGGQTPLHCAVCLGHVDVVRLLLEHSADACNAVDGCGKTPLHDAAICGHVEITEMLLGHSVAACHVRNDNGSTPLQCAEAYCGTEIVSLITKCVAQEQRDAP
eukprot:Rhum_TRINITY_DN12610_c0_g1::Rhum_TRINITY_DN12610_c0_g1_i1::g.53162::m.53162